MKVYNKYKTKYFIYKRLKSRFIFDIAVLEEKSFFEIFVKISMSLANFYLKIYPKHEFK